MPHYCGNPIRGTNNPGSHVDYDIVGMHNYAFHFGRITMRLISHN